MPPVSRPVFTEFLNGIPKQPSRLPLPVQHGLAGVAASQGLPGGGSGVEPAAAARAPAQAFPDVLTRGCHRKASVASGTARRQVPGRGEPLLRIRKTPSRLEAGADIGV